MSIYYLYVKTHNVTGLKYLGQTRRHPHNYCGSGTYWRNHLKVHGTNVSTELIAAFDNKEDLGVAGQFWSRCWNVVESDEWANLRAEEGTGGAWNRGIKGVFHHSEESRNQMRESHKGPRPWMKGKNHSEARNLKNSQSHKGQVPWNKGIPHSEETKQKNHLNFLNFESPGVVNLDGTEPGFLV